LLRLRAAACLLPELGLQPSNFCAAVFLGRGYFFVWLVIFTHPSSVAAQFEFLDKAIALPIICVGLWKLHS
jgi:hypothetical protein